MTQHLSAMPRIGTSWYYKLIRVNRRRIFLVLGIVSLTAFVTLTQLQGSLVGKTVRNPRDVQFPQKQIDEINQSEWNKRDTKSVQDKLYTLDQNFVIKHDSQVSNNEKESKFGISEKFNYSNSKNFRKRDKYTREEEELWLREKQKQNVSGNQVPEDDINLQRRHIAEKDRAVISELSELVESLSRDKEGRQKIKKMFNGLFGDKNNAFGKHLNQNIPKEKSVYSIPFNSSNYPLSLDVKSVLLEYREKGSVSKYRPINEFPYEAIFNPRYMCKTSEQGDVHIFVLFVVKTGPDNAERRKSLRQTWANSKRFPNIRTVFSLGLPSDISIAKRIKRESITYNDILLMNYSDTYKNLTLKTISGINWAVEFCSEAKYVISVDDDMYVATDLVLNHLKNVAAKHTGYFYSGMVRWDSEPIREAYDDKSKKWVLTSKEYPYRVFPSYVTGCFLMMSMETVKDIRVIIPFTKLVKFEDVYLGLVASKLGIVPIDNENVGDYKTYTNTEKFKSVLASHFYSEQWELRKAWECHLSIVEHNLEKAIYCEYLTSELKSMRKHLDNVLYWVEEPANAS